MDELIEILRSVEIFDGLEAAEIEQVGSTATRQDDA